MKSKSILLTLMVIFAFACNVCSQNSVNLLKKEKFNAHKQGEDAVGYAQGVKVGNTIYVSGSVGWGRMDHALKLAYDNIEKTLKNYGATFHNVVKENLYSTQLDSVKKYNAVRLKYYNKDFPAATWIGVKRLYMPNFNVEVEVIAVLPKP